jgi:hypothetical protein
MVSRHFQGILHYEENLPPCGLTKYKLQLLSVILFHVPAYFLSYDLFFSSTSYLEKARINFLAISFISTP